MLGFRAPEGRGPRYHADPDKTEKAYLAPGVFTLGDVGYVDEDGYVYITDRIADMVVSGGVNLYPAESEKVLSTHPAVAAVAVIGVPHPDLGEALLALIVPVGRAARPGRARGVLPGAARAVQGAARIRVPGRAGVQRDGEARQEGDACPLLARPADDRRMIANDAASAIFVPYGQGRARGLDQDELGYHGVELDRLVALGLPVVPGLTVPTSHASSLGEVEVARVAVDLLQQLVGRHIGDRTHPVLIRLLASTSAAGSAGAPVDVPGLGITADSVSALDELVGTDGAIYDVFAGVIRYLGEHGCGIPGDDFADAEYTATSLPEQVKAYLELSSASGFPFPDDPAEQLARAATAMRRRWTSPRARRSRRGQGLPEDLAAGVPRAGRSRRPTRRIRTRDRAEPRPGHGGIRADRHVPPGRAPQLDR